MMMWKQLADRLKKGMHGNAASPTPNHVEQSLTKMGLVPHAESPVATAETDALNRANNHNP